MKLTIVYVLILTSGLMGLPFYHQTDYDVIPGRGEIEWYDPSIAANLTIRMGWYNRTRKTVNVTLHLLQDLSTELTMVSQYYKFMSNEYRHFPMRFGANICDEYRRDNFGMKELVRNISNIPEHCPIKKGFYWVRTNGHYIDQSKFPPYIPRGEYKSYNEIFHKGVLVAIITCYGEVVDKPIKWD